MTNAERIDKIILKVWPKVTPGKWGDLGPNATSGSPYSILTTADNGRRFQLRLPDGDVISGNGKNLTEAIDNLEKKLEARNA